MKKSNVYITSALRTAVASIGKTLKNVPADDLGACVIENVLSKSGIKKNDVDEIILGQVLTGGTGQNPARQAAIKSGIPKEVPAYIVNQVCGSGIRSISSGFQSINSGDSKIVVAGGQESMSLAPHAIHLRDGKKLGDTDLIDTMIKDGLWDAFHGYHMGITAENVAEKFQVTRDEQDRFALKSQEKALQAQKENKFSEEIINFKDSYTEQKHTIVNANDIIHFSADVIFSSPRSSSDYIELSREFHTIFISNLDVIEEEDTARRFIAFIDECYDRNVKVIFLSNPLPNEIYTGTRLADKFQRTLSRLTEMQSNDYLQGRHKG